MTTKNNTALDIIFEALFVPYKERVPDVRFINREMIKRGIIEKESDIENDHIAFRTLGVPNLGIASFEKLFLHYGYEKRDFYHFKEKKLDAYWYAPPDETYPRIFMSELRVQDLSVKAREIIRKYTQHITADPVDGIDLDSPEEVGAFFYKPLWELPAKEDYLALAEESEYASWVIYNRYYLNHYTLSVHRFPEAYNTIAKFNDFLESVGIRLNTSGGKIKVSEDGLLKQSSTVAKKIEARFLNGETMEIPGSYVEFAERLVLPEYRDMPKDSIERIHRRDGFETGNADKIFESTYDRVNGV